MKPTVRDVAALAGVSLATVDRVLNDRPGVREVTRQKVADAMERLGFARDVAAANLARQRVYKFDFIVPNNDNAFMKALRRELAAARERSRIDRTLINLVDVPAFDEAALGAALDDSARRRPDGVAFVAVDCDRIGAAASRLRRAGVGVVTLVSDVANSARDHYVGIDNVAAGRTAAALLGRFVGNRRGAIAVLAGSLSLRDHRDRLDGFVSVVRSEYPGLRVLQPLQGRDDAAVVERLLLRLLREREDLVGLYSLGAGNAGLVGALRRSSRRPRHVVAHELDPAAAEGLDEGLIDAVLAQDPGHEIRSALRLLKANADCRPIIPGQERIQIDVYLKYNRPRDAETAQLAETEGPR
jgi:LacI family transcriptional regulator